MSTRPDKSGKCHITTRAAELLVCLLLGAMPAHAATKAWTGSVSSEWTTSGNWSPAGATTSADTANINTTSGPTVSSLNGQANSVNVGNTANGSLTISGGTLTDATGTIAISLGVTGTGTVSGSSAHWTNSGNLTVGNNGTANLIVSNGGHISDFSGLLGNGANGTGTATITDSGSQWTNSNALNVGQSGTGTLKILNGAAVTAVNGSVGAAASSNGTAEIDGIGSSWMNSGNFVVGSGMNAHGTASIQNGGLVTDVQGKIGQNAGSTGMVTVTGSGSQWTNSAYLIVGNLGNGTLEIENGGYVSSVGVNGTGVPGLDGVAAIIGNTNNSTSTVLVDGTGSAMSNAGVLLVGGGSGTNTGNGTLTIQNGGVVNSTSAYIGHNSGSTGTVTVTGSSSAMTNNGDVYVGENGGAGTLTISAGASVSTASGTTYDHNSATRTSSSTVYIADTFGSTGTLNIGAALGSPAAAPGTLSANTVAFGAGTGTLVFNHTSPYYLFSPAITGSGTIDLAAGNTIFTGDMSLFTGTINFTAGGNTAVTTQSAQQVTVDLLASQQRAMAVESRATADALLGMTRPMDESSYSYGGGLLGSGAALAGGQFSNRGATLIGGIAYGAQDYLDIQQDNAATVAVAGRYTFENAFPAYLKSLRPYAEIGGWVTPKEDLTFDRPYDAGGGNAALGEANTNATAWASYGRLGLIWDIDHVSRISGFGELGQQGLTYDAASEAAGPSNPFAATIEAGSMRMGVARIGGSWTRDLEDIFYTPLSVTLAGAAARSFDVHSGLHVTETGIGTMTSSDNAITWDEFGAAVEAEIAERTWLNIGLLGTAGAPPLGISIHGNVGLSYRF
jgi:T5SS/PEP-CTERM-associated repeat protein